MEEGRTNIRAPRTRSSHACVACKTQKRKCLPDCIMARYFQANQALEFLDFHRLFGVSNVIRMYNSVPVANRDLFMASMMYEAQMRRYYPVDGCVKVIRELSSEVEAKKKELDDMKLKIVRENQKQRMKLMIHLQQQLMSQTQMPQFGGVNLQALLPTSFDPNMVNREGASSSVERGIHSDVDQHLLNDASIVAKGKCAACKFQNKKNCDPDCTMARYFPTNRTQEFHAVQRLFGCSNMRKMYHTVPVESRDAFMETIVYEAQMRQKYPVEGCYKVICDLSSQIEAMKMELYFMTKQMDIEKAQEQRTEVMKAMQLGQQRVPTPQFRGENMPPLLPTSFNPNTVNRELGSSSHPPGWIIPLDVQKVSGHSSESPYIVNRSTNAVEVIKKEPKYIETSLQVQSIKKEPQDNKDKIASHGNHVMEGMKLVPVKQEPQLGEEHLQASSIMFTPGKGTTQSKCQIFKSGVSNVKGSSTSGESGG